MKKLTLFIVICLLCIGSIPAWATPSLQLYFDPALNPGSYYNLVNEGWETSKDPAILTTFMQGLTMGDNFRVYISLPGRPSSSDPNGGVIGLAVTEPTPEGTLTSPGSWVYGNPGLPPHGIFDAWYTSFDFTLVSPDNAFTVFNVEPPGGGNVAGYRDDFSIDFTGTEANSLYHFDLVDVTTGTKTNGDFNEFAPFSHDAERDPGTPTPPIPEPSTLLLLSSGLLGIVGYARFRTRLRKK
jgi:hypothetical protein